MCFSCVCTSISVAPLLGYANAVSSANPLHSENPRAWEIDLDNQRSSVFAPEPSGVPDNDDESESSDEDEDGNHSLGERQATRGDSKADEDSLHSHAFAEFLQFLQLGCSGSPVQGYPTIVVILSTVPSSVSPEANEQNISIGKGNTL